MYLSLFAGVRTKPRIAPVMTGPVDRWTGGLVCDESFCEVISVSLHMSVITQDGDTALMRAAREGRTEVVSLLLKAGANIHLQNEVCQYTTYKGNFTFPIRYILLKREC